MLAHTDFIAAISPPDYPCAWLLLISQRRACFRFTWRKQCNTSVEESPVISGGHIRRFGQGLPAAKLLLGTWIAAPLGGGETAFALSDSVIGTGHPGRSLAEWNCLPFRGVAQPGSALALGARGPRFESARPDQSAQ